MKCDVRLHHADEIMQWRGSRSLASVIEAIGVSQEFQLAHSCELIAEAKLSLSCDGVAA